MALVPNTTPPTYNGFTFPVETETVGFRGVAHYDQAGRTVVYVVYTITIKSIINAGGVAIDSAMDTLHSRLMVNGGQFTYTGKGMGTFTINVTTPRDVIWGPKPIDFSWRPMGENRSAEITWTVQVAIPRCMQGGTTQNALMEFNYSLDFTIDDHGYTTRTYKGHLRIPQTRPGVAAIRLVDNADNYRDLATPAMIPGFRRASHYTLSDDKCRLDFTIIDTQHVPVYPPPGVVEVSADHQYTSTKPGILSQWSGHISATYDVAPGVDRTVAVAAFNALVSNRLTYVKDLIKTYGSGMVLPLSYNVREPEIYGRRTASFMTSYVVTLPIEQILYSGLWQAVPGSTGVVAAERWTNSMANVWANRGTAGMKFRNEDDVIIDLCNPVRLALPHKLTPAEEALASNILDSIFNDAPSPRSSWFSYVNKIFSRPSAPLVELKPLPPAPLPLTPVPPPAGGGGGGGGAPPVIVTETRARSARTADGRLYVASPAGGGVAAGVSAPATPEFAGTDFYRFDRYQNSPASCFQRRVAPTNKVVLAGSAIRAIYQPTAPRLVSIGNAVAYPTPSEDDEFSCWQVGNCGGIPIFAATWRITYVLSQDPGVGVGTPHTPISNY